MVYTPNLFVTWSIGKLFVNIRESGYANRDDKVDTQRVHGTITPNIRDVVNNSDTYVGMIIDDGLGQEIWNNIRNFIGEILQLKTIKERH